MKPRKRRCVRIEALGDGDECYRSIALMASDLWVSQKPIGGRRYFVRQSDVLHALRNAGYTDIRKVYEEAK